MARKTLGVVEWLAKVIAARGDRYDYSLWISDDQIYDGNRSLMPIICREHGEFPQSIQNHLRGQNCNKCRKPRSMTIAQHLAAVKKKHGDRYSYPDWVAGTPLPDNKDTIMPVICSVHGEFLIKISAHKQGKGCIECSKTAPTTLERAIKRCATKHGNKYDYSLWEDYAPNGMLAKSLLPIICPEHGVFHKTYKNHRVGRGCTECSTQQMKEKIRNTAAENMRKFKEVHGDRYDYSHLTEADLSLGTKHIIDILCKEHGMFPQTVYLHSIGSGCPTCAGKEELSIAQWKERAIATHGTRYDYSLWVDDAQLIDKCSTKLPIICRDHGVFKQSVIEHTRGQGCRTCASSAAGVKARKGYDHYMPLFLAAHGTRYDYSKVTKESLSGGGRSMLQIKCAKHGFFPQMAISHSRGSGCKKCAIDKMVELQTKDAAYFMQRLLEVRGDEYEYAPITESLLRGGKRPQVTVICKTHGAFTHDIDNHLAGAGCSKCVGNVSKVEQSLYEALVAALPSVVFEQSKRGIISAEPLKEIDIWLPEHNIGIEVNGHYWHSDSLCRKNGKDPRHIYAKTQACIKEGIRLFNFDDIDALCKQPIIVSMIKAAVGKLPFSVHARKCVVRSVSNKEANAFYAINHLQGGAKLHSSLGLYNGDTLVSVMAFGTLRSGRMYLTRFASLLDHNVVGGFSKLLSHYRKANRGAELYSIADLRYSYGGVYERNGWERTGSTDSKAVSYDYYYRGVRYNKSWGMKSKLVERFDDCKALIEMCPTATESMLAAAVPSLSKMYDAGKRTYMIVC